MTLNGDCTTDATILVPNGFTLDGAGNTITAVDPPLRPERHSNRFGGTAIVEENDISSNYYTPRSFVFCGLSMFDSDGVRASQNHYANNERNVCVFR